MNHNSHILVVDDQPEICELVRDYLTSEGYSVQSTHDGAGMRRTMARDPVDLVILDLILPDEDGLTLARWLRENFRVGIIMLTGRGDIVDQILGLEMGADYYLTKPYHQRQLLATVNAVLRRLSTQIAVKQTPSVSKARFAGWELHFSIRELFSPSGAKVPLTTCDFELLTAFVNNPNEVLTRDRLLNVARNRAAEQFGRTIDVQVSRLRRKIENDPEKPEMIKAVHCRGYMFTPTVEWI